jgi:sugar lactone lactonase YvrE
VTPAGVLSIVAGVSGESGAPTPGPAARSELDDPTGVAVNRAGDLYIADAANNVIEQVTPAGALSVIAGDGGFGPPTPGPSTSSPLGAPAGVAVDASGVLYIADAGNDAVEKVTTGGKLSVIAGVPGESGAASPGAATSSDLGDPTGVAVDGSGNVYIADSANNVIEKVTPAGALSVVAGDGEFGPPTPGPATSSPLGSPAGVSVTAAGNLYIADTDNSDIEAVSAP